MPIDVESFSASFATEDPLLPRLIRPFLGAEHRFGRRNQTQGLRGPSTLGVIAAIQHHLRQRAVREIEVGGEIRRESAEVGAGPRAPATRAAHVFPDLLPPPIRCPHPPHLPRVHYHDRRQFIERRMKGQPRIFCAGIAQIQSNLRAARPNGTPKIGRGAHQRSSLVCVIVPEYARPKILVAMRAFSHAAPGVAGRTPHAIALAAAGHALDLAITDLRQRGDDRANAGTVRAGTNRVPLLSRFHTLGCARRARNQLCSSSDSRPT